MIVSIDGQSIETFADMQRIVSASADQELTFEVNRGGALLEAQGDARPARDFRPVRQQAAGRRDRHPPQPDPGRNGSSSATGRSNAIGLGVKETVFIITRTLSYLGDVVMGRESADQMRGPIGIAEISGQVASAGIVPLLNLTAVLSVSIGLINLFPIPLLDGGHLLFYLIEAVRRRPLSERTQEIGFRIGLAVVLMLMMFATWNDLGIVRRWLTGIG